MSSVRAREDSRQGGRPIRCVGYFVRAAYETRRNDAEEKRLTAFLQNSRVRLLGSYSDPVAVRKAERENLPEAVAHARRKRVPLLIADVHALVKDPPMVGLLADAGVAVMDLEGRRLPPLALVLLSEALPRRHSMSRLSAGHQKKQGKRGGEPVHPPMGLDQARQRAVEVRRRTREKNAPGAAQRVRELRVVGLTLSEIASELEAAGLKPPAGKATWKPEQIRRLLAGPRESHDFPADRQLICPNPSAPPSEHAALLVDDPLWAAVRPILARQGRQLQNGLAFPEETYRAIFAAVIYRHVFGGRSYPTVAAADGEPIGPKSISVVRSSWIRGTDWIRAAVILRRQSHLVPRYDWSDI